MNIDLKTLNAGQIITMSKSLRTDRTGIFKYTVVSNGFKISLSDGSKEIIRVAHKDINLSLIIDIK